MLKVSSGNKKHIRHILYSINLVGENRKIILQGILAFLFIGLAIYFIVHEKTELTQIKQTLFNASLPYVLWGIFLAAVFILVQGAMYIFSFKAVDERISYKSAMNLFIKRNFISVFLPAGGISSLAFFTKDIEQQDVPRAKTHVASSIYAFVGAISVIVVAIPVLAYAFFKNSLSSKEIYLFAGLILFIAAVFLAVRSLLNDGWLYRFIVKLSPTIETQLAELKSINFKRKYFVITVLFSIVIEFIGIAHLLIAAKALGYSISLETAAIGYIITVMFLLISPFLRGLGAIELSLSFVLTRYGFSALEAVSITFMFRFFEFWILLIIGAFSFILVRNNIFLRVVPVILTFLLGLVNIVSAMTPAIGSRIQLIHDFLPIYVTEISNYAIFMIGIMLLMISAFLLKGSRMAWYLTILLAVISVIGHLMKAIDYEEASLAVFTVIALMLTRKQYFVRNNVKFMSIGVNAALISIIAVIIYGVTGFYFLDRAHFNIDFSFIESLKYTLQNFFFYQSNHLVPNDRFARIFLYSINVSGGLTLGFLLITLVYPYIYEKETVIEEFNLAKSLVEKYGKSPLDYFKTYYDKSLFFTEDKEAFIAYSIAGNYAVVLEDPVCSDYKKMESAIRAFDLFCEANGMKSIFYRVSENSLPVYEKLKKKSLLVGQEAVVDLTTFTIEGKDKKSIRTSSHKQKELGYVSKVYQPPVKDGIIQRIHSVSNEWQKERNYEELVFSQGVFDVDELKKQPIIVIENQEEKILAFANIIPDYTQGDATYDLIRNAKGTPNGMIEFLMAEMFFYLKAEGYQSVNLGFVAMAGIEEGRNFPEKSIKFAYDKIRAFSHYKGLKEFKDKFCPSWHNKYLVYTNDYDLFSVPNALKKVTTP